MSRYNKPKYKKMQANNKYFIVYKTTNILSGKYYIGAHATNELYDGYLGSGKQLLIDIKRYGEKNFRRRILKKFNTVKEMYEYEKKLVDKQLVEDENTYNGGDGGFSKEALDALWEKRKALDVNDPWHDFYSKQVSQGLRKRYKEYPHNWIGKKHKQESKDKIGKANAIYQKRQRKLPIWYLLDL